MDGMMNLGSALTAFVFGGICMYKLLQPRLQQMKQPTEQEEIPPPELQQDPIPREPLDFVWLDAIITRMNQKKNRMKAVNRFLTNAQLGKLSGEQEIRVSCSAAGIGDKEGSVLDCILQLDDEEQQQHLIIVAEKARASICTSLEEDVDLICAMRRYGVTQTVTPTEVLSEPQRGEG